MPRRADVMLASDHAETQQGGVLDGIEQYELPKSVVVKLAKSALPANTKVSKDSVLALQKGSTVFINYLAAAAQEVASSRGHKTISSADVLQAIEMTDFGDMLPHLNAELEKYRAQLKKNPPPKKAPSTSVPKGKAKAPTGAAAKLDVGVDEVVDAKPQGEDVEEEEAFSEPDLPDEDEEDEEEAVDPEQGDRMHLDEPTSPTGSQDSHS